MNVKLTAKQRIQVVNSKGVYNIMKQILLRENELRRQQEHFWVIGLNAQSKILFIELLALGGKNRISLNAPEAFRMGIYKLATKAIFVHNHPTGTLIPSKEDIDTTDYLYKAGKFLAIDVIDHLIISEKGYYSFATKGIMQQIHNSGAWELVDTTKKQLHELTLQMEKEKAIKQNSIDIAKALKDKGTDLNIIKDVTGLHLNIIKKL